MGDISLAHMDDISLTRVGDISLTHMVDISLTYMGDISLTRTDDISLTQGWKASSSPSAVRLARKPALTWFWPSSLKEICPAAR